MRLLVIEDEALLADAVGRALRRVGYAVDVINNGEEGQMLAEVNDYDLLILDLNLPSIDGMEICRYLRAEKPELLILILTARDRLIDRISGLDNGADDYLIKPFHLEELLARVRALLRRDMRVREPILVAGQIKLDPAGRTVWSGSSRIDLTRKEFGVLAYLMRHPGEVVSQEELLEHVWDSNANPFTQTVRVHINSLRQKLGDSPMKPRFIETIVGEGYRLIAQNTDEPPS